MDKINLLEQCKQLDVQYLDFDGHNEYDYYTEDKNGLAFSNLFDGLYNEFIKPIENILELIGIDWVYFHSIQCLDSNLYAIFKDENIKEYHLLLDNEMKYNNYNFINSLINNDEFKDFSLYDMIEYLNNNYNYELSQYLKDNEQEIKKMFYETVGKK